MTGRREEGSLMLSGHSLWFQQVTDSYLIQPCNRAAIDRYPNHTEECSYFQ